MEHGLTSIIEPPLHQVLYKVDAVREHECDDHRCELSGQLSHITRITEAPSPLAAIVDVLSDVGDEGVESFRVRPLTEDENDVYDAAFQAGIETATAVMDETPKFDGNDGRTYSIQGQQSSMRLIGKFECGVCGRELEEDKMYFDPKTESHAVKHTVGGLRYLCDDCVHGLSD